MKLSELTQDRQLTNRYTVPVLLDTNVADRIARAQETLDDAKRRLQIVEAAEAGRMSQPQSNLARRVLDEAQAEYDAAAEQARDHLVDFKFESVGSDEWDELIESHPSPEEQKERLGDQDPGYDLKAFPLAAVAACLVDPEVDSLDDVRDLKRSVPDVVWQQLFTAAFRVNRGANQVPKSLTGSVTTPTSGAG